MILSSRSSSTASVLSLLSKMQRVISSLATGHTFRGWPGLSAAIAEALNSLKVQNAIIDGEIVCLDQEGRSVFDDLFFRRWRAILLPFDLLWLDGQDMRETPLIERKAPCVISYRSGRTGGRIIFSISITSRAKASCCSSVAAKWI